RKFSKLLRLASRCWICAHKGLGGCDRSLCVRTLLRPCGDSCPCKQSLCARKRDFRGTSVSDFFSTSGGGRELFREGRYDRPGCGRGDRTMEYFAGLDISVDETHVWRSRPRRRGGSREQDGVDRRGDRRRIGESAKLS